MQRVCGTGQAAAAYKALANRKTPSCMGTLGAAPLQTSVQAEAGPDATVDSISISPLPPGAAERGQTGFMVASAANGFASILWDPKGT